MRRSLIAVLAALAFPALADDRIRDVPVRFDTGASSATVSDTITGNEIVDLVLGARGGQTMSVAFSADDAGADFHVVPPGSDRAALDTGRASQDWTGTLPYDGDYRVRVFLYRGPADNGVTANFTVQVAITGSPDPDAPAPPVFGPAEWDARGLTDCGEGGTETCVFKVVRYDDSATFWVRRPDGTTRILYFESGAWSTDSAVDVTGTLDVDMWTIQVGTERYRMAEVAIIGDAPY